MSTVEHIDIHKLEQSTQDKVALALDWQPASDGGSNFKNQQVNVTDSKICVERTKRFIVFCNIFIFVGLYLLGYEGIYLSIEQGFWGNVLSTIIGSVFLFSGAKLFIQVKPFTIDKINRRYYFGQRYKQGVTPDESKQGNTRDIYALQLLSETVKTKSSSGHYSEYSSYELNFVFRNGKRLNILDHSDHEAVNCAAKAMARFLHVPVWQAY